MSRTGGRALLETVPRIASTVDRHMTRIDAVHPPNREEIKAVSPLIAMDLATPCAETRLGAPRLSSTCPMVLAEVASPETFAAVEAAAGVVPGQLATIAENAAGRGTLIFATVIAMIVAVSETVIVTGIETGATATLAAGAPPLDVPDHPTGTFEIVTAMHRLH